MRMHKLEHERSRYVEAVRQVQKVSVAEARRICDELLRQCRRAEASYRIVVMLDAPRK